MRALFLLVLSFTFLATLLPTTAQFIDPCLTLGTGDCATCIIEDNCGFCQDTGLCLTGDFNGPGGNSLNCTDWFFLECNAIPCDRLTDCVSCLSDQFCGWCFDTGKCIPASVAGPVVGTCINLVFGNRRLCNPVATTSSTTVTLSTTGLRTTGSTTGLKPSRTPARSRSPSKTQSVSQKPRTSVARSPRTSSSTTGLRTTGIKPSRTPTHSPSLTPSNSPPIFISVPESSGYMANPSFLGTLLVVALSTFFVLTVFSRI